MGLGLEPGDNRQVHPLLDHDLPWWLQSCCRVDDHPAEPPTPLGNSLGLYHIPNRIEYLYSKITVDAYLGGI